jgi:hypothetical protein
MRGSCYPALCATHVPACCSPVPNCTCAKPTSALVAQPNRGVSISTTAALAPIEEVKSMPALELNPVPLHQFVKSGV